nr:tail fiber protein [uncultured Rhodopila sp.]
MSDPFIGQILAVGFNYTPVGWLACNGQLVPINDNQALFSLLGTTYGGNGTTNFAVPDLRGRAALGQGQGQGASLHPLGQAGGSETAALAASQAGAHSHTLAVSTNPGTASKPAGNLVIAPNSTAGFNLYAPAPAKTTLSPATIGTTGGGQPHENRQPYLAINYIICSNGAYPTQD